MSMNKKKILKMTDENRILSISIICIEESIIASNNTEVHCMNAIV